LLYAKFSRVGVVVDSLHPLVTIGRLFMLTVVLGYELAEGFAFGGTHGRVDYIIQAASEQIVLTLGVNEGVELFNESLHIILVLVFFFQLELEYRASTCRL